MLQFGTISKSDPAKGLYKVDLDEDEIESDWIPRLLLNTKNTKDEAPLDIGEHVVCMMDERCENGVILGAINSDKDVPVKGDQKIRRTEFPDGSYVEFDGNTGEYEVNMTGDVKITGAKKLIIQCPTDDVQITCQNLKVTGNVDVTGKIDASLDVTAYKMTVPIALGTHKHPYVNVTTPATTSPPIP